MQSDAAPKPAADGAAASPRSPRDGRRSGRPVIRNPLAADVVADAVTQLEHVNGTMRIEFAVLKPAQHTSPAPRQLVQVARVVLPEVVAQRLCLALYDYLKKEGPDPTGLVSEGQTAQ